MQRADEKHHAVDAIPGLFISGTYTTEAEDKTSFVAVVQTVSHDWRDYVSSARTHKKKRLPKNLYEHNVELITLSELVIAQSIYVFIADHANWLERQAVSSSLTNTKFLCDMLLLIGQHRSSYHIIKTTTDPTGASFNICKSSWRGKEIWLTITKLFLSIHDYGCLQQC